MRERAVECNDAVEALFVEGELLPKVATNERHRARPACATHQHLHGDIEPRDFVSTVLQDAELTPRPHAEVENSAQPLEPLGYPKELALRRSAGACKFSIVARCNRVE